MQEKGPGIDTEMTNAVIEVLAEASQHVFEGDPNPFCAHIGDTRRKPGHFDIRPRHKKLEVLPKDVEKNFSGFLVRTCALPFKFNSQKLISCTALLKDRLLITRFEGLKSSPQDIESWLRTLIHKLRGSSLASPRVDSSYHVRTNVSVRRGIV